jgi:hypothetical protein
MISTCEAPARASDAETGAEMSLQGSVSSIAFPALPCKRVF